MRKLTWTEAGVVLAVAGMAGQLLVLQPWRLAFNVTPSEPMGLYAYQNQGRTPNLGELIRFRYTAPIWAYGRYAPDGSVFLKRVGAVAGEVIQIEGPQVFACNPHGCRLLGQALEKDSAGRALPAPPASMAGVIPAGAVYMQSVEVPNSYDSRYFGLIYQSKVLGPAYPLITWH